MNEFFDTAQTKLAEEVRGGKEGAMADEVRRVLTDFARQDAEFAQAIAQSGDFRACMEQVAAGVGSHLPDIEAYRRAVRFYFAGAEVRFHMELILYPDAEEAPRVPTRKKILDIADFL